MSEMEWREVAKIQSIELRQKDAEIARATRFLLQQNQELREQRAGLTEEIERLKEQRDHAMGLLQSRDKLETLLKSLESDSARISELEAECIGHIEANSKVAKLTNARISEIEAQAAAMRIAAQTLRNEVRGTLHAHELAIRYDSGNSNWACLERALEMVEQALSPDAGKALSERVRKLERVYRIARNMCDQIKRTVDLNLDWTGSAISMIVDGATLTAFAAALADLDADKGET